MVADMEVDMVAIIVVNMGVDMVDDMVDDMVADIVADMEVDNVADRAKDKAKQAPKGCKLVVGARDPDKNRLYVIVWPCRRESGTSWGSVMVPAYDPILVINLPLQLSLWENLGTDDKDF